MRSKARIALSALLLLLLALAVPRAESPIWRVDGTPEPLPVVQLSPGEAETVSVIGATTSRAIEVDALRRHADLDARVDGLGVSISATEGAGGYDIVEIDVRTESGQIETLMLPVVLAPLPLVTFEFDPQADMDPSNVSVAGSFNGWSANEDRLTRDEDGVWRLSLPLPPGDHSYKFVVDGEWMADPNNPRTDDSGYGNSLLTVTSHPLVSFEYKPGPDEAPSRVYLAGTFNDWSAGADAMARGEKGVFHISKRIPPGEHAYKFVVDGEWIPDPANPKRDASGYDNSLLVVEGQLQEHLNLSPLSARMPGAGDQGGVLVHLPDGDELDAESTVVILNNERLDGGEYSIDTETGSIGFNVAKDKWLGHNFVTVVAETTGGRMGWLSASFATPDAVRSPRDEIIYYAVTDRFYDGDPSRNQPAEHPELHPLANYHGGDWAGIRKKIEEGYFDKLGVTTLWISPVNKNTQKVERESVPPRRYFTSYHGYWPISLEETNEQFGSMEDLQSMVAAAHDHGIAVLLDFVVNHVHEDHPLIQEHPNWSVSLKTPDGRMNIRLFDEFPMTTWFDTFLPTLDYAGQPELLEIMTENAVYWLNTTDADGFRHDAVKHIPTVFWKDLTSRLRQEFMEKGRFIYQVGETISGHDTINEFVGPELLNGQFDFPLYFTIQNVLARGGGSMEDLAQAVLRSQHDYPAGAMMSSLLGNHDVVRFMGYADGDMPPGMDEKEVGFRRPPQVDHPESYDKIQLGFALLMGLPNPPTIYYGDEIGHTGAHDPDNRRPMPWDWTEEQQATFDRVSELAKVRHESLALRRGAYEELYRDDERLVFARISPSETVIVSLARKPDATSSRFQFPEHWGEPASLAPLTAKNSDASLTDGEVTIEDADYGFGLWRVVW